MGYKVLGVGYPPKDQSTEKEKWSEHEILFDFADTWAQAIERLQTTQYSCVIVCSDHIENGKIAALRRIQAIPFVVMPPEYSSKQRQEYAVLSVIQYIHATDLCKKEHLSRDDIQHCLELTLPQPRPLTLITVKDMSFCLEHRSVEVCGQEVHLTAKEFDILALLICNQRQVFTHETIVNCIWGEDAAFYSRKIVTTHISNLRRKLKTLSDSVDYIESVHGVGYRFNADK